ncbi:MAG: hypothetical protein WC558_10980, partial [Patulibacter sp.]
GRGVAADAIRRFFPELSPAEVRRLRGATWSSWVRLRALEAGVASPRARWPYPPVVAGPDPATLAGPLVLAGFHLGPIPAVGALLERLPDRVLVLQLTALPRDRIDVGLVGHDRWQRAAAFRRALDTLRRGRHVFVLVDANVFPSTVEVTLFGRRTSFARGAFALGRITGCPVVPVASRWRGGKIEIVAGEPIPPGPEAEMAAAAARWLEAFVRESPEVIGQKFIDTFWGDDVRPVGST